MGSAPRIQKQQLPSRGCAGTQFPGKLHDLMTYTEQEGLSDIISWIQHGQAIMVHDPERLLQILPLFGFSQTKYRSFQRQLNMWHWDRILEGPYKGGWVHPFFLRGNKKLCSYMSRHGIPKLNILQNLMNEPDVPKPDMLSETNLQNTPCMGLNEFSGGKIEFPRESNLGPKTPTPMKSLSSAQWNEIIEDEWEPLPVIDSNHTTFDGSVVHFSYETTTGGDLGNENYLLEPTPIREYNTVNHHLLEPLTADTIDFIF